MPSGRQLAIQYFITFNTWIESRTDAEFSSMASRAGLARKQIAEQCGFCVSVLSQNADIRKALKKKEAQLRADGVLPAQGSSPDLPRVSAHSSLAIEGPPSASKRLNQLEQENASLKLENRKLKRELERFSVIREVLSTTGRYVR